MPVDKDDTNWDLVQGPELPDADIEVGYILKKSAWGRGVATEVCRRLIDFAFEETSLVEVVACISPENNNSRNVLIKSGLTEEGIKHAYAEDLPFFRITRQQWMLKSEQN